MAVFAVFCSELSAIGISDRRKSSAADDWADAKTARRSRRVTVLLCSCIVPLTMFLYDTIIKLAHCQNLTKSW
jgi:hypothetical protein